MFRKLTILTGILALTAFILPQAQARSLKNNESLPWLALRGTR